MVVAHDPLSAPRFFCRLRRGILSEIKVVHLGGRARYVVRDGAGGRGCGGGGCFADWAKARDADELEDDEEEE